MFNQIFIAHLKARGLITQTQGSEALELARNTRVRIGVLAIESGLMTEEQVEDVNHLQATQNARFGDIAIAEGFVTQAQFEALLGTQPKSHTVLKQILTDERYLMPHQFEEELVNFKNCLGATDEIFAQLQDNYVPTYVTYIAGIDPADQMLSKFAEVFLNVVVRLIDHDVFVKKAVMADGIYKHLATQQVSGGSTYTLAFGTTGERAATDFASAFCKMPIPDMGEDGQDCFKEFLNCVSGMMATELSNAGTMELDLSVPEYHHNKTVQAVTLPFALPFGDFSITIL